jgi:hypothetical protein
MSVAADLCSCAASASRRTPTQATRSSRPRCRPPRALAHGDVSHPAPGPMRRSPAGGCSRLVSRERHSSGSTPACPSRRRASEPRTRRAGAARDRKPFGRACPGSKGTGDPRRCIRRRPRLRETAAGGGRSCGPRRASPCSCSGPRPALLRGARSPSRRAPCAPASTTPR